MTGILTQALANIVDFQAHRGLGATSLAALARDALKDYALALNAPAPAPCPFCGKVPEVRPSWKNSSRRPEDYFYELVHAQMDESSYTCPIARLGSVILATAQSRSALAYGWNSREWP
jgi:hypothetical protein